MEVGAKGSDKLQQPTSHYYFVQQSVLGLPDLGWKVVHVLDLSFWLWKCLSLAHGSLTKSEGTGNLSQSPQIVFTLLYGTIIFCACHNVKKSESIIMILLPQKKERKKRLK